MTTFIHTGNLLPPGGPDDGMSLGVLNRHQEVIASLTVSLAESFDTEGGGAVLTPMRNYIKHLDSFIFVMKVVAVGAQTNVSIALSFPSASVAGTNYGAHSGTEGGGYWTDHGQLNTELKVEAEFISGGLVDQPVNNSGWACNVTGAEETSWTATFTRATLAAGTHYIYVRFYRQDAA